jgi:hypothetical protein
MRTEELGHSKGFNDPIRKRTRDLLLCGAVPQPTLTTNKLNSRILCHQHIIQLIFHRTTPLRFRLLPAVLLSITEFTNRILSLAQTFSPKHCEYDSSVGSLR